MDKKKLTTIPSKSGVYLWKDKFGEIIYIGKAKNLRIRMQQYFKGMKNSYKTSMLVQSIASFDYVITKTDHEALVLERNLIDKHHPKFNIKLMDDKHYPYLCVNLTTKLEISLIYRLKTKSNPRTIYYGPFPNGYGARRIVNLLNRFYTYNQGLPISQANFALWQERFKEIKMILSAKRHSLMRTLEKKMYVAAKEQQFEIAHDIKETINAFKAFELKQTITLDNYNNIDVIGFVTKNNYLSITLLFYRQGSLLSKIDKIIEITTTKEDAIRQFVGRYYQTNLKPNLIITNEVIETDQLKVIIPEKGRNKKILYLALSNAADNINLKLETFIRKAELTKNALDALKFLLGVAQLNKIIIIDNSHTNNTLPVSVLLTYRNGIKVNSESRKYNLLTTNRQADVDYLNQALTKHFINQNHLKPDLLIVDGGKAQVNEAKKLLPTFRIIGLVKNKHHKTEALINEQGQKVAITNQSLFIFLSNLQVEVDKYAKMIHHKKRQSTLEGVLRTIPGIGPVLEQKLIKYFGNYANIYNASFEKLITIVSPKIALAIKQRLGEK